MKKIFTLLTLLVCVCTGAWASTVSDLKTIATDYVFIADNFTNVGTTQLTNNTLYDGGLVLACGSGGTKTVSTGKGTSTIEGTVYKNSLRVKTTQDNYAFKVSGPCTLTIYKQAWKDCEDSLIMELRNHLTPLLNAVNTLESILKEEADKEALKQVFLKNETIKLMYEEIDNISTLNI